MRDLRYSIPLLMLPLLTSCATLLGEVEGSGGPGQAEGTPSSVGPHCRGDWGQSETGRQFSTLMLATASFIDSANHLDARLGGACRAMGADLKMTSAQMYARGTTTAAICGEVAGKVRVELAAVREARIKTKVETTPPVCTTSVREYRECVERCEPRVVSEGRVEYSCQGGELRGGCSGSCSGQCSLAVQGACDGSCEGTCDAGCSGTCNGICEGQCSSRGADGQCHGSCSGTCRGSCTSGCRGSCHGQCVVSARGGCNGQCRGGCSVEWQQPVCTGRIVPPEIRTECRQMCDTYQVAHEECTPGEAKVIIDASAAAAAAERARTVTAAIAARAPEIQAIRRHLEQMKASGETIVRSAGSFGSAVGEFGATALMCSAQAAAELPRALAQVNVAVDVSVKFSASAGVNASY